ncbi:MAG: hypothetical protein M0C28_27395 [Candidatus Moduliflexus flocculans]|nr:hypothetical protein [Candidatus Moduliflexus flocculans]
MAAHQGALRDIAIGQHRRQQHLQHPLGPRLRCGSRRAAAWPSPRKSWPVDIPLAVDRRRSPAPPLFRTRRYSSSPDANGALLLGAHVLCIAWIVLKATGSRALGAFNGILFHVVFPA